MPSLTLAQKIAMIPPPPIAKHPAYRSSRSGGGTTCIEVIEIPEPPASLYAANVRQHAPRQQRSLDFVLPSVATRKQKQQQQQQREKRVPSSYTRRRPSASSTSASTYRRRSSACSYSSFATLQRCNARQPSRVDPSLEKAGYCYSIQNSLTDDSSGYSSGSGDEREIVSKPTTPTEQLRSFFSMKMRRAARSSAPPTPTAETSPARPQKRAATAPAAAAPPASNAHRRILGDILGRHAR